MRITIKNNSMYMSLLLHEYSLFVEILMDNIARVAVLLLENTYVDVVGCRRISRRGKCRRDSGAEYAVGSARIFLSWNNCERNVVVAAAKHATRP